MEKRCKLVGDVQRYGSEMGIVNFVNKTPHAFVKVFLSGLRRQTIPTAFGDQKTGV